MAPLDLNLLMLAKTGGAILFGVVNAGVRILVAALLVNLSHVAWAPVDIRVIHSYIGHSSLETTMKYLRLTQKGSENAYRIIDSFMSGFAYERA